MSATTPILVQHTTVQLASSNSSFNMLLPPPLLALVASHLPLGSLLRLQRCSSTHHRLRTDDAYMSVAWRWAVLRLSLTQRLYQWTLPYRQCVECIDDSDQPFFIPVSVWQAAMPVFRAVLAKADERDGRYKRLRELLNRPQPTRWILVRRVEGGWLRSVEDDNTVESADLQRVEVLSGIDRQRMTLWWEIVFRDCEAEVRCGLVLKVCPYLHHLDVEADSYLYGRLRHADSFALLPRLRSLCLTQRSSNDTSDTTARVRPVDMGQSAQDKPIDFRVMLSSLPHLTSLRCMGLVRLHFDDVLALASHSTLDELHIVTHREQTIRQMWNGVDMCFHSAEEQKQQEAVTFDGDIGAESDEAEEATLVDHASEQLANSRSGSVTWEHARMEAEMERIRAAVTRTQPTLRSCQVRLALADWLHRWLLRRQLEEKEPYYSEHRQNLFRLPIALLRCTLRQQLSELAAATMAADKHNETVVRGSAGSPADTYMVVPALYSATAAVSSGEVAVAMQQQHARREVAGCASLSFELDRLSKRARTEE